MKNALTVFPRENSNKSIFLSLFQMSELEGVVIPDYACILRVFIRYNLHNLIHYEELKPKPKEYRGRSRKYATNLDCIKAISKK